MAVEQRLGRLGSLARILRPRGEVIAHNRDLFARLGTENGPPLFRLDPADITQFHEKHTIVIRMNQDLLKDSRDLERAYDDAALETTSIILSEDGLLEKIRGELVIIDEEITHTQEDIDQGRLSADLSTVIPGLQKHSQALNGLLGLHERGISIAQEKRRDGQRETSASAAGDGPEVFPTREGQPQPTRLVVDEETGKIIADGNAFVIKDGYVRGVFIDLANDATRPGKGVKKTALNRRAAELGATQNDPSSTYIPSLNRTFMSGQLAARVEQSGTGLNTRFRLINADIQFILKSDDIQSGNVPPPRLPENGRTPEIDRALPTIGYNAETGRMWFNGHLLGGQEQLGELQRFHMETILFLAANKGRYVKREEIEKELAKANFKGLKKIGRVIHTIRDHIKALGLEGINPFAVIDATGDGRNIGYQLHANVIPVDAEGKPETTAKHEDELLKPTALRINRETGKGTGNDKKGARVEIGFTQPQLAALDEFYNHTYRSSQRDITKAVRTAGSNVQSSPGANTLRHISEKFGNHDFSARIRREGKPGPNCEYVLENCQIEWVADKGNPPTRAERTVRHLFPNGRELAITPQEALLAEILPFYPEPGTVSPDTVVDRIIGGGLTGGTPDKKDMRRYVTQRLMTAAQSRFEQACVVVANETAHVDEARWKGAQYFGIAVDVDDAITTMEAGVALAALEQHATRPDKPSTTQLHRDIYQNSRLTWDERTNPRVLSPKELMALFSGGFLKAVRGRDAEVLGQITANLKGKGESRDRIRLLYKVLSEIAVANHYFEQQGKGEPSPGRVVHARR